MVATSPTIGKPVGGFGPAAGGFGAAAIAHADAAACDVKLDDSLAVTAEMFSWDGYDLEVLALKERPGFKPFVSANRDPLKALAGMRNEQQVLMHLGRNTQLLEGVAHVRAWFFDRHLAACKSKTASLAATVQDEAAGFFLLDAAADAARATFMEMETPDIKKAATMGVNMLATALLANGDTAGIRAGLSVRVDSWTSLVRQAANEAQAKQQMKSKWAMKSKKGPAPAPAPVAMAPPATVASIPEEEEEEAAAAVVATATGGGEVNQPDEPSQAKPKEQEHEEGLAGMWKSWFG